MLELRYVVEHLAEVRELLGRRGPAAAESLGRVEALAQQRVSVIQRVEALRQQQNEANDAMARLDKKSEAFGERRTALKQLSADAKELDVELKEVESDLAAILLIVPNLPAPNAPIGKSEHENVERRKWGQKPSFDFAPQDHVAIGTALGILDFERAAKISGARFCVLKGAAARLERALMAFMLDLHAGTHGYTEVWPPALVNDDALRGTGQLPKFAADQFRIAPDWEAFKPEEQRGKQLYLVPTAEVPVTNLHAGEILEDSQLPIRYVAYTPCFRSEAGSYGRDTRGLIRQHQFDKVELVRFERAEDGEAALDQLVGHAEVVLQKLGLHYRVMELCTGDMGANARRCFDLEVWLPGQDAYREISSCSWFGDFQARRANIRYRTKDDKKPRLVHTLNGSGLAIGRTLVAILEQCQQPDGSVRVPAALQPYMGGLEVIR